MVVWNDQSVRESVFLGDDVRQIDVWGRAIKPQQEEHQQVIEVGAEPTFVTGLNKSVTLWRMGFAFDPRPLASIFGQPQTTSFRFVNTFKQGVGGRLDLRTPETWGGQKSFEVKLAAGEEMTKPFEVVLSSNARTGEQPVRIDFEITADRSYKFSVYRTMQVGLGDVVIDVNTQLDEDGNLVVTQNLINHTDEFVSFDCLLFVPNHRRQRIQVLNLGRGRNTQTYFLPDGEALAGQTLVLRAEEIGGQRVLNYHVTVER